MHQIPERRADVDDTSGTKTPPGGKFTESHSQELKDRSDLASTASEQREVTRDAITVVDDMRRAMQTRSSIDVAKGLIMATMGCDEQAAFHHLVSLSQRRHTKLHDLAAEIITSHQIIAAASGSPA